MSTVGHTAHDALGISTFEISIRRPFQVQPAVNQPDNFVDDGIPHLQLRADCLYQPVYPLDVKRTGKQCAGSRRRSRQHFPRLLHICRTAPNLREKH
jgi:hypothetical protein